MSENAREWLDKYGDICFIGPNQRDDFEKALAAYAAHCREQDAARIKEMEAEQPCKSPDPLECDNQNNHPWNCHCDNPVYWKQRAEHAEADLAAALLVGEELRKQLRESEREIATYKNSLEEFVGCVLSVRVNNTVEWMEGVCSDVNALCERVGDGDRFRFDGDGIRKVRVLDAEVPDGQ